MRRPQPSRRDILGASGIGAAAIVLNGAPHVRAASAVTTRKTPSNDLTIKEIRVTPIALPDPPILSSAGCHGPYFLRTIVELVTTDGITGIGEAREGVAKELHGLAKEIVGQSALAYRGFRMSDRAAAAIEVACLDAIGKAKGLRLCDLLGGPVREDPEFAAYLFYRYAADHPALLADKRIVDGRGSGDKALDPWGEVRTPEAMAEMAFKLHERYGFRVHKLKGGVLTPDQELETLRAMNARFGGNHPLRIDPNGCWSVETAVRIGNAMKDLPIEYYEDPVSGREAMAAVRKQTKLPTSTNAFIKSVAEVPPVDPSVIDVVLVDHHYFGGITGCVAMGPIARLMGWKLSQHSNNHAGVSMAAMINVGAVIPELTLASDTHYIWLPDDADILVGKKLPIVGGRMKVPGGPGLGVELDRDKLARAHETYTKCGMTGRDDAHTMRLVEPNWKRPSY
jgi:glucarate dehydratase